MPSESLRQLPHIILFPMFKGLPPNTASYEKTVALQCFKEHQP